jgi:endo-1,4-beta-xylanase
MRSAVILLVMAMLILSACAPVAAPTATVPPPPSETPAPSATPVPTATPTRIPTATPTPIPTLPPEQVGGLEGVPDPRYSNPELFDLNDPEAPIPQFVNAMRMAGIEIDPPRLVENVRYQIVNGVLVASYYLDPEHEQQGETLEGDIPLFVGEQQNGPPSWRYSSITTSLRKLYDGQKFIGSQVVYYMLDDQTYTRIAAGDFNQLLINGELNERILWGYPSAAESPYERYATYDLTRANQLIAFAKHNGMRIVASHLVDARVQVGGGPFDLPEWMTGFDKEEYVKILQARVMQLASHFEPGTVFIVVNEAFDWNRLDGFWLEKIGPEYLEMAFSEARKANPGAALIYNDVNVFADGRIDDHDKAVFALVRNLKEKGLIDGVGFQMHIDERHRPVSPEVVRQLIEMYEKIGVKVYVTEFDVDLTYLGLSEQERQRMKTRIFGEMFELFLTSKNVDSVTFFGFTSDVSWKPDSDAHLFDKAYRPEPAFYEIARLLLMYAGAR